MSEGESTGRSATLAWAALVALASAAAGYRYGTADWSKGLPGAPDQALAAVLLGGAALASTLRLHPWAGPLLPWAAFGAALTLSAVPLDDPLWLVGLLVALALVGGYVLLVAVAAHAVRLALARRRSQGLAAEWSRLDRETRGAE